jgi:hypothetical protein
MLEGDYMFVGERFLLVVSDKRQVDENLVEVFRVALELWKSSDVTDSTDSRNRFVLRVFVRVVVVLRFIYPVQKDFYIL